MSQSALHTKGTAKRWKAKQTLYSYVGTLIKKAKHSVEIFHEIYIHLLALGRREMSLEMPHCHEEIVCSVIAHVETDLGYCMLKDKRGRDLVKCWGQF